MNAATSDPAIPITEAPATQAAPVPTDPHHARYRALWARYQALSTSPGGTYAASTYFAPHLLGHISCQAFFADLGDAPESVNLLLDAIERALDTAEAARVATLPPSE